MVCSEHRSVAPSDSILNFPSTSDFRDVSGVDAHDYASGVNAHDHAAADLQSAARPEPATLAPPAREPDVSGLASIDELRDSLHSPLRELRVPTRESIDEIGGAPDGPRSQHRCSHCGAMCSNEEASAMQKKQRHVPENLQHDMNMVDMVAAPPATLHLQGASSSKELSGSQSMLGGGSIWTRFLTANRPQDDASSSMISCDVCAPSTWASATASCRALLREGRRKALVAAHHPDIWLTGLLMLVVLLLATLGSLLVWADETTGNMRRHAQARPPPTSPWR